MRHEPCEVFEDTGTLQSIQSCVPQDLTEKI